ncbi:uncharacterized protein L203_103208 [Cryptococcus depauperatus CBS 7841]|uniref:Uncharacterized protein n=1 Tax=Cryptococcus depauperatus CBS 7841 TaxID=1295531 RepID=A0A1E3HPJ9_9TREE|nr:ATP synthase mitochondrial F1 complex assembly factor 1 [Cryptococcus depauperatus CBS 7841]
MSLRLLSHLPTFRQVTASRVLSPLHSFSTITPRCNILTELEDKIHPREVVEQKKKLMEEKYADKLREKAKQEGLTDLEELKAKVLSKMDKNRENVLEAKTKEKEEKEDLVGKRISEEREKRMKNREMNAKGQKIKEEGARGIKPLSSIINLPLIHLTPHTPSDISQIWNTYHTSHPTLSTSFLSATLSISTYESMLSLAKENPFFVVPLPKLSEMFEDKDTVREQSDMKTDEYEMFYLQWLFQPTHTSSSPPSPSAVPKSLPQTSCIIFTPLEEFKKAGEWAQPYLILTHYPDLAHTHDLVFMRGEISPASTSNPGSLSNPGFLLSQQQAQLLALALQRFYCTAVTLEKETEKELKERVKRMEALTKFRTSPGEWDWTNLIEMAYGGYV